MHRRGRQLEPSGDATGAQLLVASQAENLALQLAARLGRRATRPARPINPPPAIRVGLGTPDPLVDGVSGNVHLTCHRRRWRARLDAADELLSTPMGQPGVSVQPSLLGSG